MTKLRDALETAHELGERFPDLSDREVIEHVNFVHNLGIPDDDHAVVYRCVIIAYSGEVERALNYFGFCK